MTMPEIQFCPFCSGDIKKRWGDTWLCLECRMQFSLNPYTTRQIRAAPTPRDRDART